LVTVGMLHELNALVENPPAVLRVTLNVVPEDVPVVGVLEQQLPGALDFVVNEAYARELRSRNRDPQCPEVASGPVPARWLDLDELPPKAVDWLEKENGVELLGDQPYQQHRVWRFQNKAVEVPRLSRWELILDGLRRRVQEHLARMGVEAPAGDAFIVPR